jgi:hypothetical protein
LRDAERADTVEQRFREELPVRALDGEWHRIDRPGRPESSVPRRPIWQSSGKTQVTPQTV